MQHFPIYLSTRNQRIVLSGGGGAAIAKLRLLLKTEAALVVYTLSPDAQIVRWGLEGRITLVERKLISGDIDGATLFYGANEDIVEDARVADIARAEGAIVNVVDNLDSSDFITPAIVDRAPVTIAIGTEGAAPVLARAIKADLEERLSPQIGLLAKVGKAFRPLADHLPMGRARRAFWADYYFNRGPKVLAAGGEAAVADELNALLNQHLSKEPAAGRIDFVSAEFGDPELLTLKARKLLDGADVVVHDRAVNPQILELARREAVILQAGNAEAAINHAREGAQVVRLKLLAGRQLNDEVIATAQACVDYQVIPGVTSGLHTGPSIRTHNKEQVI